MPRLDVPALIKTLGGPTQVVTDIASTLNDAEAITVKGVEKWISRGQMKSCWLIVLLHLPVGRGKQPLDLRKFIVD
ncbi:hypothetical protein T8K17_11450 [Thalassobaculum sp. OXR-137]|uniref:hypothetical protein n=1 Tax=Thalassobaculum sp. OXR-137 TaxID=3100173 RepID=UPI002AC8EEE9|nr:hypothetical protein [Thalassobaculum sp. OXR-137]WPZ36750.1 hypothetical protein T8K17_11450 [Thalassobaculum sp. OXR-137]